MLEIVTEEALVVFTVTFFDVLVPTTALLQLSEAGVKLSGEVTPPLPTPLNPTTSGVNATPSLTVTAPSINPFCFGLKVRLRVHLAPAASVAPQGDPPPATAE